MEILMRDRNATTEGSNLLTRHSILSPVLIPIYFPYRVPFLPCSNRFSVSYVPSVARVSAPFSSANANNAARIKLFGRFHRNHCESRPVLVSIFETILWNSVSPFLSFFSLFESCVRSIAISIARQYNRLQDLTAAATRSSRILADKAEKPGSSLDFSLAIDRSRSSPVENVRQIFIVDSTVDSRSMRKCYLIFFLAGGISLSRLEENEPTDSVWRVRRSRMRTKTWNKRGRFEPRRGERFTEDRFSFRGGWTVELYRQSWNHRYSRRRVAR